MPRKKPKSQIEITVDTREQLPYPFDTIKSEHFDHTVISKGMKTGDYGLTMTSTKKEDHIVLERKSLADLYSSLTSNRLRFEKEIVRMTEFGYAAVIVEADWQAILNPNSALTRPTLVRPKSIAGTMIAWEQRHNIHFHLCPTRAFAERFTFRMLERWARDHILA